MAKSDSVPAMLTPGEFATLPCPTYPEIRLALPGFARALRLWLRDLRRDRTVNRMRRFAQALVLAHEMQDNICHLHAHFLHTPGSVARYTALMRGLSWSFSAHAKDIWTTPQWELKEKLADCAWGVSCTAAGAPASARNPAFHRDRNARRR